MTMHSRILTLFTRTPLHIGAGSSVGAIDQPIVRERHTRFPVIPGSSIKGVLAGLWSGDFEKNERGDHVRKDKSDAEWLFGNNRDPKAASAGALLIGEGKLLAFPVRSAKGAFAWITCPLALGRFARDTGSSALKRVAELKGEECHAPDGLCLADKKVILEEYVLDAKEKPDEPIVKALADLTDDAVWQQLKDKLVILSDELFAYFAENACETAQHIRIDDQTGTVAKGALFNQENVPSEALFYSVLNAQDEKRKNGTGDKRPAVAALKALEDRLSSDTVKNMLQIGADETTGLGWCTVATKEVK